MVKEIRLYIEGGDSSESKKDLRKAFRAFIKNLDDLAKRLSISLQIIFCGSDELTYKDFKTGLAKNPDSFNILLVDSDSLVTQPSWTHLATQEKRKSWDCLGTDHSHCHLMVQEMEAWFLADIETLKKYYGQGFNEHAIPTTKNIEQIEKGRVVMALETATRNTKKGKYHKTRHAPPILERLDATKVCEAAPHCKRLFKTLTEKMN